MRVIIAAAGGWEKWDGQSPHLVEIEGEILLHRTIRQVKQYTSYIWLAGPYEHPDVLQVTPVATPGIGWIDCYLSTQYLWSDTERTVHLLGDVWFSDETMKTIMTDECREWMAYGRFGASKVTTKQFGEGWAISFYPEHHLEHATAIQRVVDEYKSGKIKRTMGWEHYAAMEGAEDLNECIKRGRWTDTGQQDWTEDFDWPINLERWLEARREAGV